MNHSGPTIVASSVIVPSTISRSAGEQGTGFSKESSTQKRRLSTNSPDSKRPRLAPSTEHASSRRRSSIFDGADERKRGQKMFGNLLGTLGKIQRESSSTKAKAGANRRAEIEAKLAERLQREKEELAQKEKEQNDEKRREVNREVLLSEQKMEKGIMQTRHSQLLHQAHFIQTKAEPRLYYLPWKLSSDEDDQIDEQIVRAKDQIIDEEDEQRRLKKESEEGDEQVNQNEDANQTSTRHVSEPNNPSSGTSREKDESDIQMKDNDESQQTGDDRTKDTAPKNINSSASNNGIPFQLDEKMDDAPMENLDPQAQPALNPEEPSTQDKRHNQP
ncbi:Pinin 1 [Neolecta irregularis DAH-3]|uniref:Pinin 1 n=1 Tax=Neolecta irregularis (strain DAH-3) TaxID=1198029 RepID=A0A1U7LKU4_NEOID|nr:Pinin 1 [Neolecta irregularis DAH-3]|eukprot:OLL23258.1 Pinin 1 [Neolecta irregularis DAH-3]